MKDNLWVGTVARVSRSLVKTTLGLEHEESTGIGLSDEELAKAFQKGDQQAFQTLIVRHQRPLYNFILRFLGQPEVAEEAFQEVFLRVIRSIENYEPSAKFTTWLYKITRNYCIDYSRKQKFRNHLSLDETLSSGVESLYNRVPLEQSDSDELSSTHQLGDLLERILNELNPEQREVFLLREMQGLQFDEIAKITKTSSNTVKSRMRYALRSIQLKFEAYGISRADIKKYA